MHTDSIQTLLRTLSEFNDIKDIKIEGRVLTPEQKTILRDHPIIIFTCQEGSQGYGQ